MFDEEPPPRAVVLDSDFVINVLHENEDFHSECLAFAGKLASHGTRVVCTPLLRLEFWQGWRRAIRLRGLPSGLSTLVGGDSEAERLFRVGDAYLKQFLDLFGKFEAPLDGDLLDEALKLAARLNLRSHDPCIAALSAYTQVGDVVSLDKDFLRVDGLRLWNNNIPARRSAKRLER